MKRTEALVTICIADDSAPARRLLVGAIAELKGIELLGEAENGRQAIDLIRSLNPDAVVLDLEMPGGSGIEVLEAIKQTKSSTVVIIFTMLPHPFLKAECLKLGADFFFDKVTQFNELIETLQQLVEAARWPGRKGIKLGKPGFHSNPSPQNFPSQPNAD